MEMASRSTGETDARDEPARYAALGIPEYWRFEETGNFHGTRLAGDRLVGGRYEPIAIEEVEEESFKVIVLCWACSAGGSVGRRSSYRAYDSLWPEDPMRKGRPSHHPNGFSRPVAQCRRTDGSELAGKPLPAERMLPGTGE